MDPSIERAIAERARTQLGLVTRPQLRDLGVTHPTIRRRIAGGHLEPIGSKTFRIAGTPPSPESECLAACLDLDGVASHRTGAWLRGLLSSAPSIIDVTVVKGQPTGHRGNRPTAWRVHTSTSLPDEDVSAIGAIPVTSVARTLFGLAALSEDEVSDDELLGLVERAVAQRLASDRWLWWLLEVRRCRGRDGVARFENALAQRAHLGPTESWLERELLRVLADGGLPRPTVQRVIRRRGAFVARVDALYEEPRIVLEAMGHATHSSRQQVSADLRRAHALREQGYEVLAFTYDHVVREPSWVRSTVRRALVARGALAA